jgi:hypothetical protein
MIKTIILSCALIFSSYLSYSQTVWKRLDLPGAAPEDSTYSYQLSSLLPYNEPGKTGLFKVWLMNIERKITINDIHYRNIKTIAHWAVDCANREYKLLSLTYYNLDGTVIESGKGHDYWEDAVPESTADAIVTSICPKWKTKKK